MFVDSFLFLPSHGVQRKMISVDNFFLIFEIIIFCYVVAICDLVHAVEATYGLPLLQFAVSRASLIFQKGFPDAVSK